MGAMLSDIRLAVLGAGNIGGALIEGLLETGQVSGDSIRATVLDEAEAAEASLTVEYPGHNNTRKRRGRLSYGRRCR